MFVLDFASPKPVRPEGAAEGSSPAAQALSSTKAGARRDAESFARSLEKAQGRQRPIRGGELEAEGRAEGGKADGRAEGGKAEGKAADGAKRRAGAAGELLDGLRELLGNAGERELIQLLMKASPKELLRYAESLGLDGHDLSDSVRALKSMAASERGGQNRNKLVRVLEKLAELLGAGAASDASAVLGRKRVPPPQETEPDRSAGKQQIGEVRSADKKPRVVVVDLRRDQPASRDSQDQPGMNRSTAAVNAEKITEAPERDGSVLLRAQAQGRAPAAAPEAAGRSARPAADFQSRFIPEVVKQTGIILKSGGAGEIRLVLKPENLGSVRIRLALSESSLEGRIVVDNNSVKELVESSLDNLRNALRMEGYQTNLEVSVGHRRSQSGQEQAQAPPAGWLSAGSEEFEKAIPMFLDMKPDYELINLFA